MLSKGTATKTVSNRFIDALSVLPRSISANALKYPVEIPDTAKATANANIRNASVSLRQELARAFKPKQIDKAFEVHTHMPVKQCGKIVVFIIQRIGYLFHGNTFCDVLCYILYDLPFKQIIPSFVKCFRILNALVTY